MLKEAPRNLQIKAQKSELTTGFKYDILPERSLSGPSAFQPERKKMTGYHLEPAGASWETGDFPGSLKCQHRSSQGQKPPKDS